MSTSHDWARELQATAAFMLSKPEVEVGNIPETKGWFFSRKEVFLGLVRALKPGKKVMTSDYINFLPVGARIELTINRDALCRRLNPEYECEPLLSKEEDAEMEVQGD